MVKKWGQTLFLSRQGKNNPVSVPILLYNRGPAGVRRPVDGLCGNRDSYYADPPEMPGSGGGLDTTR